MHESNTGDRRGLRGLVRDALRRKVIWHSAFRHHVWESGLRVPWLIAYNVVGVAALMVFFAASSQGEDLLRISAELGLGGAGLIWNGLFLATTLIGSLAFWYSSMLLLGIEYPGYRLDPNFARLGRRWWPRALGVGVPLAISYALFTLGPGADSRGALAWGFLLIAALLLAFYVGERMVLKLDNRGMIQIPLGEKAIGGLTRWHLRRAGGILAAIGLLVLLFMLFPVGLPRLLGAPAIAVLGVAGICLFGAGVLTWWPLSQGAPPLTLAALVLFGFAGFFNDNHAVRVADGSAPALERPTPTARLASWQVGQPADAPVILVAASGGGIRAGYWTATTLAWLEEQLGAVFGGRVFAISSVSGGSLGAATYLALKRAGVGADGAPGLLATSRAVLGEDFLSPVVAGMLFPDLMQRFIPWPALAAADRQRFLEKSWEAAFDGEARRLFKGPFQALYVGPGADRLPSLLLNTTLVGTGQRAVVSNLRVDRLADVVDLLDPVWGLAAIRTSAAAGASARFTYVSPAGTVPLPAGGVARVVDGGYFENSGAATLVDLLAVLSADQPGLKPILLVINNDPEAPPLCPRDGPIPDPTPAGSAGNGNLSELITPFSALLATRGARGTLAQVNAADLVDRMGGKVIELPLSAVLAAREAAIAGDDWRAREALARSFAEPPLGWSLSAEVRHGMDETLDGQQGVLKTQVQYLRIALGLESGEVPACRPRGIEGR